MTTGHRRISMGFASQLREAAPRATLMDIQNLTAPQTPAQQVMCRTCWKAVNPGWNPHCRFLSLRLGILWMSQFAYALSEYRGTSR